MRRWMRHALHRVMTNKYDMELFVRHCEEQSDEAILMYWILIQEIASLRSQ